MSQLSDMRMATPTLYSVSSTGKLKQWTVSVQCQDKVASIIREHGYVGAKIQSNEKIISKGKNIGKANETSPYEQAISEALSMRQKRLDTGYTEEVPDLDSFKPPELPMLAHGFAKRKHNIVYPAFVQPKLDGVRCFAKRVDEDTITFTSRKGKSYTTLDHLVPALLDCMEIGEILDGEIYIHGKTFQHIVRLVKKLRPESITLQFHIYDIADATTPYYDRMINLWNTIEDRYPELVFTDTKEVDDESGIYEWHDQWVQQGYEGVIIRNRDGMYKFDNRSADLQKYKEFIDEEFEIVGGDKGTGLHEGCVIFTCAVNKDGPVFNVYPRGSLQARRDMFGDLANLVGKYLTVRYQQLSEDGIPIFPIGIVVRDYE
ncbi:MAG: hypothetical protein KUG81_07345 [Gammaproteobacteria bacterium]|nr:hypothetical protein [Gammaproteobacteria bacterium]